MIILAHQNEQTLETNRGTLEPDGVPLFVFTWDNYPQDILLHASLKPMKDPPSG
jgi:hypothetical protein